MNMQPTIIKFGEDMALQLPPDSLISWDFDGVIGRWQLKGDRWIEVPNAKVLHRLRQLHLQGHRNVITTHRTEAFEGNPAYISANRRGLTVAEVIRIHDLPIHRTFFTHMGDKGSFLKDQGAIIHYDDEMGNLQSVVAAGLVGVKVDHGDQPPKIHLTGDGMSPEQQAHGGM